VVRSAASGHARVLGPRQPELMPSVYAEADVFCLPSWWEAMPLSVLEAMAAGLPVVATDVGEVSRVVIDGEHGFVPPPHAPEQLADSLRKLLGDAGAARRMGDAARSRAVSSFSSGATDRAVGALYDEVTGRGAR
jgi:glycosyltransferase involved in cell wall biosynthesis